MRKFFLILFFVLLFSSEVYGEDLLSNFEISAIEKSTQEKTNLDFSELFNDIISGNFYEVKDKIYDNFKWFLTKEIKDNAQDLKIIVIICLLIGLLHTVVQDMQNKNVYELVSYIGQILILSVATVAFKEMIGILKTATEDIIDIINASMPLIGGIMALGGNSVQAAGIYSIIMFVSNILISAVDGIIIPLICLGTLIKIVNIISNKDMLNKMSELFYFVTYWLIKGAAFIFVFLISFEKISSGSINSFIGNGAKSVIKMVPFIGDIYGNGADIALSAVKTLNSGISIAITIILILTALTPFIKIFIIAGLYKIIAAAAEPVSDKETIEIIDTIGESGKLILGTLFSVLFIFVTAVVLGLNSIGG